MHLLGIYSGSGLEADLMDKIPNRNPEEPDYPDYQMTLFSVAQDEGFLDYGLDMNIKAEVTAYSWGRVCRPHLGYLYSSVCMIIEN